MSVSAGTSASSDDGEDDDDVAWFAGEQSTEFRCNSYSQYWSKQKFLVILLLYTNLMTLLSDIILVGIVSRVVGYGTLYSRF